MKNKMGIPKTGQVWVETKPFKKRFPKTGQVWVETVIYTLIGLVLIGTVLAFATPFINEQKDKATIERTAESMNSLDNTILNIKGQGIGNKREFSFLIGEGSLIVDGEKNEIKFSVDESNYAFSEPGISIDVSGTNMKVRTTKSGKKYDVILTLEYNEKVDITYNKENIEKTFDPAPNPYRLIVENLGKIPEPMSCLTPGGYCLLSNGNEGICNSAETQCVPKFTNINIYDAS